jgi:exodeoxyribonuclease-1
MAKTFFFYDLETSGLSPRHDRIMQFAGIRTDMDLKPIGEPYNLLVKLNDDTLPSPEALMVTGITPQQTVADGYTEAEFAKILYNEVFTPDTVAVGFNNIRFDDEFLRYLFWRNFYDPYEWSWKDGRSRWDLLDVVRMTRALRPDGIEWPVDEKGNATNRLELLTMLNGIDHLKAHDALSDVEALIAVTGLIREKQPQLFEYLFKMRDKKEVQKLVNLENKQPFVYVSGRYDTEYNKATVAFPLTSGRNANVVVYDLRYDPTDLLELSVDDLKKKLFATREDRQSDDFVALPVKELQYNRAPAVAPLGVLQSDGAWERIALSPEVIEKHKSILLSSPAFAENIRSLFEKISEFPQSNDPEAQLYDSFVPDTDKIRVEAVRNADADKLADFNPNFIDERLGPLLLHYKARSFPSSLSENEVVQWEKWRAERIAKDLPGYMQSIQRLASTVKDENKQFILQELHLWAESIIPSNDT